MASERGDPPEKPPGGAPAAPPNEARAAPGRAGKRAFALRLDASVHAAVEKLAAAELRSVNAQIECLLREALKARGARPGEED